jgi:hypothetical protein
MLNGKATLVVLVEIWNHVSHSAAVEGSEVRWDMLITWDWISSWRSV